MKPLNELKNLDKEISINSIEILVYLLMLLRKCKSWQENYKQVSKDYLFYTIPIYL